MNRQNIFVSSFKFLTLHIIGDFIYFPIWWYTEGLLRILVSIKHSILDILDSFAIKILFKHLLTPMYGDYSWSGRLISFFVRIVHFIVMFCVSLVWIALIAAGALVWMLLPPFILYTFFHQWMNTGEPHILIRLIYGQ